MSARIIISIITALTVLAASLMIANTASAQCPMCVRALEQNGGEMAAGFNRGILFLLGMPYLVFTAIGASWYLKRSRNRSLESG